MTTGDYRRSQEQPGMVGDARAGVGDSWRTAGDSRGRWATVETADDHQ